ncbi:Uncharacterized protein PECH_001801 [Penicillium ucsense]|uniref:Oleate hydratase n=1 Tax=Penicillium ucsense TaxID=2839758 RepID=A0A8J8WN38_9EURO|nr:Uncharacterized protein PECM_008099 [Penicillium ucsense]KAF7738149.1 Uncharacterized protein PECH_001801 [Penicillium ucsense]
MTPKRDPQSVQAWLIGSGIASLAAAVHLIKQAKVPANQVHIIDAHHASGGAMETSGNAEDGYTLHTGALPYFYEQCVKDLLAMVPSRESPEKSLWEAIREQENSNRPLNKASTRAVSQTEDGTRRVDTHRLPIGAKLRMDLIKFVLESERSMESKKISDVFDANFFESEFWKLWSTTFLLQEWHSAAEFHRLLSKWLPELHTHNDVRDMERTPFTLFESLITPITTYLKEQGVDFRFNVTVTDLKSYPSSDPTTISELVLQENGHEYLITLDPVDIVIVSLGSVATGTQTGSNKAPPPPLSSPSETILKSGEWSLWQKLERQSTKFGNPANFSTRPSESQIETFTVTLHTTDFMHHYAHLTRDKPGTGALLTITECPWDLTISVPHQPVFATQPKLVHVIWGYALRPERIGKYVKKPMLQCSGQDILRELLSHLGFACDSLISSSITIPCLMPLGTSMLLSRAHHDRPDVIPHGTTNLGLIGQYVEVPGDAACSLEYSVRGAQIAVATLMELPDRPSKVGKNKFLEVLGLLL